MHSQQHEGSIRLNTVFEEFSTTKIKDPSKISANLMKKDTLDNHLNYISAQNAVFNNIDWLQGQHIDLDFLFSSDSSCLCVASLLEFFQVYLGTEEAINFHIYQFYKHSHKPYSIASLARHHQWCIYSIEAFSEALRRSFVSSISFPSSLVLVKQCSLPSVFCNRLDVLMKAIVNLSFNSPSPSSFFLLSEFYHHFLYAVIQQSHYCISHLCDNLIMYVSCNWHEQPLSCLYAISALIRLSSSRLTALYILQQFRIAVKTESTSTLFPLLMPVYALTTNRTTLAWLRFYFKQHNILSNIPTFLKSHKIDSLSVSLLLKVLLRHLSTSVELYDDVDEVNEKVEEDIHIQYFTLDLIQTIETLKDAVPFEVLLKFDEYLTAAKRKVPRIDPISLCRAGNQVVFSKPAKEVMYPEGINHDIYSNLPDKLKVRYIASMIPALPVQITKKSMSYVSVLPDWVAAWIKKPSYEGLSLQQAIQLTDIVKTLNELSNTGNSTKETTPCFAVQPSLLKCFIDMFLTREDRVTKKPLKELISMLSVNNQTLALILDYTAQKCHTADQKQRRIILKIIGLTSRNPDFSVLFGNVAAESLAQAFLKPDVSQREALQALSLLATCRYNFPHSGFKLLLRNLKTLNLLSTILVSLSEEQKEILIPFLACILNDITTYPMNPTLTQFLRMYPSFIKGDTDRFLHLLDRLLTDFTTEKTTLISLLLSNLCPPRESLLTLPCVKNSFIACQMKTKIPFSVPKELAQTGQFWTLMAKHQILISNLIANNPTLLNGPFSFLKDYHELLSFDAKFYLIKATLAKSEIKREIRLHVRRGSILSDSMQKLQDADLRRPIKITFTGEDGIDAGGLLREWLTFLTEDIFNSPFFIQNENKTAFSVQKQESDNYSYLLFAGKVLGKAVMSNIPVGIHLERVILKKIIGVPLTLKDLRLKDEIAWRSLTWLLDNSVEGLGLSFDTDNSDNDSQTEVSESNKFEYIEHMTNHLLTKGCDNEIATFVQGFHSVVPQEVVRTLLPIELDFIICGIPMISLSDFTANCEFEFPYTRQHPTITLMFDVISEFDGEMIAKFVEFLTGSPILPYGGFAGLRDEGRAITIIPGGGCDRLPVAHTCNNSLALPMYQDKHTMMEKLLTAIYECNTFEIK